MGKKNKKRKFAEVGTFPNFFQPLYLELQESGFPLKGKWNSDYFKNDNPITVELGCGKGDYTYGLAKKYPNRNFIGIDIKGARIWKGAKDSLQDDLNNVAFIRGQAQHLEYFFTPGELSEVWITFPDPQLQKPRIRKRFTHPTFLERYKKLLKPDHLIHLKTDSVEFFDYTLEVLEEEGIKPVVCIHDLYGNEKATAIEEEVRAIKTYYEQIWLAEGRIIKYVRFKLND